MKEYNNKVFMDDIRILMKNLGYRNYVIKETIKNLIYKKQFIEIDYEELLPILNLKIRKEEMQEIINYIEEKFDDSEYLVISKLKDYRKKLPYIGYKWTAYFIRSISCLNGYKAINGIFLGDRRSEKIIIVRDNSNINTFDELLIHIIKNEYSGVMNEVKIYDYLMMLGVVTEHKDISEKKYHMI